MPGTFNASQAPAQTAPEILKAAARYLWFEAHRDDQVKKDHCPPSMIPTPKALAKWLPECLPATWRELWKRLNALDFHFIQEPGEPERPMTAGDDLAMSAAFVTLGKGQPICWTGETLARAILDVNHAWRSANKDLHKHPILPLVEAWQERARDIEPERRTKGIIPTPFVQRHKQPCLPDITCRPGAALPGLFHQEPSTAYLPGLEPEQRGRPALLALFDLAGGASGGRKVAPLDLRIFVEGLMAVPVEARDGHLYRIKSGDGRAFTIREIAGEWLQWKLEHYKSGHRHTGEALKRAMRRLRDLEIPMGNHGGFYYPLMLEAVEGWGLNHRISFLARFPPGSGVGPSVDRNVLRVLGKRSEPAYRAYLALCFEWDRYGGHNGKLILPTRPIAKRDMQGRILDANGRIVTGNGGVLVKSPYDPRAILTGDREPNPARNRYPEYWANDLTQLCFRQIDRDGGAKRKQHTRARWAVELIEKAGGCTIERLGSNPNKGLLPWRVMPPSPTPHRSALL